MLAARFDHEQILRAAPLGVIYSDPEGVIVWANSAAERLFGYGRGELVGRELAVLLPDRDVSRQREERRRFVKSRRGALLGQTLRITGKRKAGEEVRVDVSLSAHDVAGRLLFAAFVTVPATESGPGGARAEVAQEQLLRRDAAEEQLTLDKEAFLAMVAHQLKSPVQPILASLRTLQRAAAAGVDVPPDTVPRALRQVQRLARSIDVLLDDIAQLEAERPLRLSLARFDLRDLLDEIAADFSAVRPHRRLTLRPPDAPLIVVGDRDRIAQILGTLLENAAKYSPPDTPVDVEASAEGGEVVISVRDRGIGIPGGEHGRVFGKFYRASNAPAHLYRGLGLGLYLARSLADHLGARLWFTSEVGRGATFFLAVPAQGRKERAPPPDRATPDGRAPDERPQGGTP